MARPVTITEDMVLKASEERDIAGKIIHYRSAITLLLLDIINVPTTTDLISEALGVTRQTLFADIARYRGFIKSGSDLHGPGRGGRYHSYMTLDEEDAFLQRWAESSKTGGVLTAKRDSSSIQ
jgi:hypothetical protein